MHCGQSFFFLLLNNCFTILYRFLPHINMNQSQAYLCPHPAQRPSHIPPILKVVTECWVELPGWLTSDFSACGSFFSPFCSRLLLPRGQLSVWRIPWAACLADYCHSLNCSLGKGLKRKRAPNPTSLPILGINAVVICSSHQASPEEWAGPVSGIKSASRDSSPTSPLLTGCSDDVGSLISKHWRPPSFLCVKIIMMSLK